MALAPVTTGAVAQALRGIDFPCDRDQLVRHARGNRAEEDVIDLLGRMPDARYDNMADVLRRLGTENGA